MDDPQRERLFRVTGFTFKPPAECHRHGSRMSCLPPLTTAPNVQPRTRWIAAMTNGFAKDGLSPKTLPGACRRTALQERRYAELDALLPT
jgi:hypothetical protein